MNVLIIGGTRFQGIYLVDYLLSRGAQVTVCHRGNHALKSDKGDVEEILGDRNSDLERVPKRFFDWIVDTCAYRPEQIESLLNQLSGNFGNYCFISSVYAYTDSQPNIEETSKLKTLDNDNADFNANTYGAFKAECERTIERILKEKNYLILRPSVIIGPGDHSGRMDFWLKLYSELSTPLSFPSDQRIIQMIDVRDYSKFVIDSLFNDLTGVFNLAGKSFSFQSFIGALNNLYKLGFNEKVMPEWSSLKQAESIPYATPQVSEDYSSKKAVERGLVLRELKETLHDCKKHTDVSSLKSSNLYSLFF
jgi:2'-hydroxyisoflavone reductase